MRNPRGRPASPVTVASDSFQGVRLVHSGWSTLAGILRVEALSAARSDCQFNASGVAYDRLCCFGYALDEVDLLRNQTTGGASAAATSIHRGRAGGCRSTGAARDRPQVRSARGVVFIGGSTSPPIRGTPVYAVASRARQRSTRSMAWWLTDVAPAARRCLPIWGPGPPCNRQ